MRQSISMDKTWLVIIVLFFIFPPLGFIAIIGKVIFMILQSQNNKESVYSKDAREVREIVPKPRIDDVKTPTKTSYAGEVGNVIDVKVNEPTAFEMEQKHEVSNTNFDKPINEHQPSDTPDLNIEKVHIDTIVSVEDLEKKLHVDQSDTESAQPIKVVVCTMCDTKNPIYKIDVFETPSCKKCGMLLLDRS